MRAWAAGLLALACASTGPPGPLASLHPYLWAHDAQATLLLCRWTTDRPLGVASEGADAEAASALATALAAWRGAGLGLDLVPAPPDGAGIVVRFVGEEVQRADGSAGTGRTVADCALRAHGEPRAELVAARVDVARRLGPDWRGHFREPSRAELVGTLVHELGHALGFQGHVVRGEDPMQAAPEAIRRTGEAVLAGRSLAGSVVAALYARPSGEVVRRVPVDAWRTQLVDRMQRVAERNDLAGPFLRMGDVAGRIWWRDAKRREYGIQIPEARKVLRDPASLLLLPEARTRAVLPRSRDTGPR